MIHPDYELAQAWLGGDKLAGEELVKISYHALTDHIRAYVRVFRHDDRNKIIDELRQDVYFHAFIKMENYKGLSSFSTWLQSIADNLDKKRIRTEMGNRARTISVTDIEELPADGLSDPSQVAAKRFLWLNVRIAFSLLKFEDKQILLLRSYHDIPYKMIESKLEIKIGSLISRHKRALERLRKKFQEMFPGYLQHFR